MYELLLQMIARYFAFCHETPEQREVLAHAAVGLMFQAIKPLGLPLARLPVGPATRPGCASRSASTSWPSSAAGVHPPVAEDVTATVSDALSRAASNVMSHVEAV